MMKVMPKNLIETFSYDEEGPSRVYVRRIVKDMLRHAIALHDLMALDAENLWQELGYELADWVRA